MTNLLCPGCQADRLDESSPPAKVCRKVAGKSGERNVKQSLDCEWNQQDEDPGQMDMSFIPLDGADSTSPFLDSVMPLRKVAVSEILPLTLVGNQVSLGAAPTNSALPLSPIFIKTNNDNNNETGTEDKYINVSEYYNGNPAGLLDNLEEITSLPNEFLNIGELYWRTGEYFTVLFCTVLYCTVLYCTLSTVLFCKFSDLNSSHLKPI